MMTRARLPRSLAGRTIAAVAVVGLLALGALGGLLVTRADSGGETARGGAASWTVRAEHRAVIRLDEAPTIGSGTYAETRSTVRIWFAPGSGWRMEVESAGAHARGLRIYGADGTTAWAFDPATSRYSLQPSTPASMDPRTGLAVMMGTALTDDLDAALAALRRLPNATVTEEGEESVAGRRAAIVRVEPLSCWESSEASTSGQTRQQRRCEGYSRSWLDAATGWVLKSEADNGRGGGFTWETPTVEFDVPIEPELYQFTPPAGAIQVDALD